LPDNELWQLYRAAYEQYQCVILNGEKAYNRYVNDFFAYHLPSVGLNEADMRLHVMHVFAVRELLELRRDLVDVFFTKDKFEEKDYLKMDKLFNSGKAIDVKPIALANFSDAQIEKLKVFVNSKDIFVDELETNDIKKLFACKLEHPLQASSNRNVAIFLGWLRYYNHLPYPWQMIIENYKLISSSKNNKPLRASQIRSSQCQGKSRKMNKKKNSMEKKEDAGFDSICQEFAKSL